MKTLLLSLLVFALSFSGYSQSDNQTTVSDTLFNFENYTTGNTPHGWTTAITGRGKMCVWSIVNDNGNRVMAQTSSEAPDYQFNLVTNNSITFKDVEISVRFKAVKGRGDQGGGPVWRYRDENNYYVVRANPLENNYRVYKVVNGNRIQIKSATVKMTSGKWYNLKVIMKGNNIQCYFNDQLKLQTDDNTFPESGKIGLWTKSDAVTWFDDLLVKTAK